MSAEVSALSAEAMGCMTGHGAGVLTVAGCPELVRVLAGASGRAVESDEDLWLVMLAVVDVARQLDANLPLVVEQRGALIGVLAYFGLGEPMRESERRAILTLVHDKNLSARRSLTSQPGRFIFARWREARFLYPGKYVKSPPDAAYKTGRDRRSMYADALAYTVANVCTHQRQLRRRLAAAQPLPQGLEFKRLLRMSDAYSRDISPGPDGNVARTIEPRLIELLSRAPSEPLLGLLTGEAGAGKSTLLASLSDTLQREPSVVALLVSTAWLTQPATSDRVADDLLTAVGECLAHRLRPVVLLDTLDLMLRDDSSRTQVLCLLDALSAGGATVLCSCRPQEAEAVRGHFGILVELGLYDDDELDRAISQLTAQCCPSANVATLAGGVRQATVRGLPAAEVCRSPLLLYLLFALSPPSEPELSELDVTGLLDLYWERRVERDARHEAAVLMRADPAENMASVTGWAAIGLLARGVPELKRDALVRALADAAGPGLSLVQAETGINALIDRGVLRRSGDLVGFLHQALFEFAAAKGLLASGGETALAVLADRVTADGGDLFVGAVLEQALILTGTADPGLAPAAKHAAQRLIEQPTGAIQAIGAVAWAHHPGLVLGAEWLKSLTPWAALRAAQTIPKVTGRPPAEAANQLAALWRALPYRDVRAAVLKAIERLAGRTPSVLLDVISDLDGIEQLISRGDEQLRTTGLHLIDLLAELDLAVAKRLMLTAATTPPLEATVLRYVIRNWALLGCPELAAAVVAVAEQDPELDEATVLPVVADLLATDWGTVNTPRDTTATLDHVRGLLDRGGRSSRRVILDIETARACLPQLADDELTIAFDLLLGITSGAAFDHVTGRTFPLILAEQDHVAASLERRIIAEMATIGLAAQRQQITVTQRACLALLTNPCCPPGLITAAVPGHLVDKDWLADDLLTNLLPVAIATGHHGAQATVEAVASDPSGVHRSVLAAVMGSSMLCHAPSDHHLPGMAVAHRTAVHIALGTENYDRTLAEILISADWADPTLRDCGQRILDYARAHMLEQSRPSADAVLLYAVAIIRFGLEASDIAALPALIIRAHGQDRDTILEQLELAQFGAGRVGQATTPFDAQMTVGYLEEFITATGADERWNELGTSWHVAGRVDAHQAFASLVSIDSLCACLRIFPNASPPIRRTSPSDMDIDVARYALDTLRMRLFFDLQLSAPPPTLETWVAHRTLGLYELEDSVITVRWFDQMCYYLMNMAHRSPDVASRYFLDYLTAIVTASERVDWGGLTVSAKACVIQACRHLDNIALNRLLEICLYLPRDLGQYILGTAALDRYSDAKSVLENIATRWHKGNSLFGASRE